MNRRVVSDFDQCPFDYCRIGFVWDLGDIRLFNSLAFLKIVNLNELVKNKYTLTYFNFVLKNV